MTGILAYVSVVVLCFLLDITADALEKVTYKGEMTMLYCPNQTDYSSISWTGPNLTAPHAPVVYCWGPGDVTLNPHLGDKRSRLSISEDDFSMTITDTQLVDNGAYTCLQELTVGTSKRNTTLLVRIRPSTPTMNTSVQIDGERIRAIEDKKFDITCTSIGGYPAPTVALYRGGTSGTELNSTTKVIQVGNTFTVTLTYTLTPTRQDDRQELICRSYYPTPADRQDTQNDTKQLYLYLKPTQPTVTHNGSMIKGHQVEFKCTTTGSRPAAQISWMYSGQNVTTDVSTTTSVDQVTVVSLFRKRVDAADNGQTVQCRVTHTATDTVLTKSTTLNVHFPVDKSSTTITGNKNIIANGIDLLTLNCTTGSSNPPSNITWSNMSTEIRNIEEYSITSGVNNGYVRSQVLILQPTRYAQNNTITCSVSNGVLQGRDTAAVQLDLRFNPVVTISTPSTRVIPEEPKVPSTLLPCSVDSYPISTITWFHNEGVATQAKLGSSRPYIINNSDRTSYGIYKCSADNGIPPNDSKSYTVHILFRPLDITIQKHPSSVIADGTNYMYIVCISGTSNPVSSVTWATGKIQNETTTSTVDTGQYGGIIRTSTISFKPTRDHDGLNVSCEAKNNMTGLQTVSNSTLIDNIKYSPMISNMFDKNVTEGDTITLKCDASSKPLASFIWRNDSTTLRNGIGTNDYNGLDYIISSVNRRHTGSYSCIANNTVLPNDEKQIVVTVQYPPDITVIAVNTSVTYPSTTITCKATGVPDKYTYERWVHTWWNGEVLQSGQLHNTSKLTLTNLSYAHSGVYECGASNGIKEKSYGSGGLLVKSFPIIVGDVKELKASAQLNQRVNVTFRYYSNVGDGLLKVFRINSTEDVVDENNKYQSKVNVTLPVFDRNVETPGTETTITINITRESEFGAYGINVTNGVGTTELTLVVQPLGPPEPPYDINITVLGHQSVDVMWKAGFPNGLNQTFVLQLSQDNTTWNNVTMYGGLLFPLTHTKNLDKLSGGQLYYLRMVSINGKGESEPTSVFTFTTTAAPPGPESGTSIGLLVGGAVGGLVAAICVVALVVFILWRRNRNDSPGKPKDKGALVESRENVGFDDRDETVENAFYVSAGPVQRETSLTAQPSKQQPMHNDGKDIYAQVNKKPEVLYAMPIKKGNKTEKFQKQNATDIDKDLYAQPDKSHLKGQKVEKHPKQTPEKAEKGGKKKKGKQNKSNIPTGDIYENAPSHVNVKGSKAPSGDGVYEDTTIGASLMPEKPTRTDGLLYADLEFKSPPKGKDPNKIIGIEDRCEYTTIDLTKKAKPLPDSDDESKDKP